MYRWTSMPLTFSITSPASTYKLNRKNISFIYFLFGNFSISNKGLLIFFVDFLLVSRGIGEWRGKRKARGFTCCRLSKLSDTCKLFLISISLCFQRVNNNNNNKTRISGIGASFACQFAVSDVKIGRALSRLVRTFLKSSSLTHTQCLINSINK